MTNGDEQLQQEIIRLTGTSLKPAPSGDVFREQLALYVNDLIVHDFERLTGLLYRLDVSEQKLKEMLAAHTGTDAGLLIADAIIKRQQEKIVTRARYAQKRDDIPEEDRW